MNDIQGMSKVIEMEQREVANFRHLSVDERSKLLAVACQDAAAIERSRRAMGLPDIEPTPWPDSTWNFLAEAMRRVRTG
jgi:hypothetical protein